MVEIYHTNCCTDGHKHKPAESIPLAQPEFIYYTVVQYRHSCEADNYADAVIQAPDIGEK